MRPSAGLLILALAAFLAGMIAARTLRPDPRAQIATVIVRGAAFADLDW